MYYEIQSLYLAAPSKKNCWVPSGISEIDRQSVVNRGTGFVDVATKLFN